MGTRIIVGSSNKKILKQLSHFLNENGYNVVGETTDGYDILRRIHTVYPDLCIMDFNMKGLNGHDVGEVLVADNVCPIITIIGSSELHYFTNLKHEPIFSLLVKPINKDLLINTIDLLVKTSRSITRLRKEVSTLKKKQEDKQIINQAKQLLIEYNGLTEEEAHRKIQKLSMNKGISKKIVAIEIINKYK
ncbi:ANTAR domain-containing response regulator [Vallitalea maricola]|uniref:ANTAR domain-containing response regulator n=1 Tax=Vallitalea maricola TaxID=3074433 RepID=A0ACB5ULK3_9FIRM|nr:ANTAR domain-containing response regulator [Vallitalea sp. AN17-2]